MRPRFDFQLTPMRWTYPNWTPDGCICVGGKEIWPPRQQSTTQASPIWPGTVPRWNLGYSAVWWGLWPGPDAASRSHSWWRGEYNYHLLFPPLPSHVTLGLTLGIGQIAEVQRSSKSILCIVDHYSLPLGLEFFEWPICKNGQFMWDNTQGRCWARQ